MSVFVKNMRGESLMPCKPSKARKLLKQNKAKIVQYEPFTIQLLYGSSGYKQPVDIGIDLGAKHVGVAIQSGGCYVKDIEDNYITIPNKNYKQVSFKNLELVSHNNNWQFIPHL